MREQDARAAPRLRFSKEEMQPESLEHLSGGFSFVLETDGTYSFGNR